MDGRQTLMDAAWAHIVPKDERMVKLPLVQAHFSIGVPNEEAFA